jgi:hypothetical protein
MFILETEQATEAPSLDQILRDWWARLSTWLWRRTRPEERDDETLDEADRSESLIL